MAQPVDRFMIIRLSLIIALLLFIFCLPVLLIFQPALVSGPQAVDTVTSLLKFNLDPEIDLDRFTPSERSHLSDVYELLSVCRRLGYLSVSVIFISLVWLINRHQTETVYSGFKQAGLIALSLCLLLILGLLFSWNNLFIGFHQLFFPQGNWAFSPDSLLISLFPETFWFFIFKLYFLFVFLLSLSLLALAKFLRPRGGILRS